jgi:phage gpG-like protein
VAVRLIGLAEFDAALKAMTGMANAASREATGKGAHLIEAETKKNLAIGTHKRGEPTTSAPGTPPDLVTGQLRRSIRVKGPRSIGPQTWEASVGPTAVYGRIQELGGDTGRHYASHLPARPYLAPAFERLTTSGDLAEVYTQAWKNVWYRG